MKNFDKFTRKEYIDLYISMGTNDFYLWFPDVDRKTFRRFKAPMNDNQRFASKMNWLHKIVSGAAGNLNQHAQFINQINMSNISSERQTALCVIKESTDKAKWYLDLALRNIKMFHQLPK